MKLYYITNEALDNRSAAAIHIDAICKNMTSLGHIVTLYAPVSKGFTTSDGSYNINFIPTPRIGLSVFFQLRLFYRLRRDIKTNRPDIIYSRHSQILFIPAKVSRFFGVTLVLEANGRILEEAHKSSRSLFGKILLILGILKLIESFNINSANKIIAVSDGIKEYFIKNYRLSPSKIEVVTNGVDTEFFKPTLSSEARAQINLDEDSVYVGYIGSFYSWQGIRYMVEAAKIVSAQRSNAKFIIVGNGDEYDNILRFVQENKLEKSVEIRPAISHDLVPEYINAFDICLCYPTLFRAGATSPFKVYEYLACAKSVILADIEGMREEFGDIVSYAEPESAEALAKSIVALIDSKDERERLGTSGRKFVEQGRSWRAVTERIITICNSVTK